jgi:ABC-type transport system substrate-binding protein
VAEVIIGQLNLIGFKASARSLESAASTEANRAVKPDQDRPDLHMTSASSPILDASRPFDLYYLCGGRNHIGCDPEVDRLYNEAKVLEGEAREKGFQAVWAYAYDKYYYVPLFALTGPGTSAAGLGPRVDGMLMFANMSLKP